MMKRGAWASLKNPKLLETIFVLSPYCVRHSGIRLFLHKVLLTEWLAIASQSVARNFRENV